MKISSFFFLKKIEWICIYFCNLFQTMNSDDIDNWNNHGFCIVKDLIKKDLILNSNLFMEKLYQTKELSVKDFGSNGKLEFPSNTIIDNIMIDENIIHCVKKLLKTDDILLVQADAWGKEGKDDYTEFSNNNQRMHMDYGNNSFLHPSDWENPECVAMIVYLSDIKKTGGGTAVVPKSNHDKLYQFPYKNMPGIAGFPFYNDKSCSEQYFKEKDKDVYHFRKNLYDKEIITEPDIGDILFYRLDLWHRGTPVKEGQVRFVINLLWKKKECFWINFWNPGWTKNMYYGYIEDFFTKMSPLQRTVLGVPPPGHTYWDFEKVQLLQIRYPKIDIEPYLIPLKSLKKN